MSIMSIINYGDIILNTRILKTTKTNLKKLLNHPENLQIH